VGRSVIRHAPSDVEIFTTSRKELDLTNYAEVRAHFKSINVDSVIFAAARVGGILANSSNQLDFLLENLKIQNSVIQAALDSKVNNFLFLGSSCIYPKFSPQPIKETSLLTGPLEESNEGYAIAKIAGLKLCREIYQERGLNYFSLMPTNLYGPGDNFDANDSHVPASLMRRFHAGKLAGLDSVEVWGTGKPTREFMHVFDLSSACWYFLNQPLGGELINIGTGSDISINDFAELMKRVVGFEGKIQFDLSKPDGTPRKVLDVSKAKKLGWTPQIALEEGLASTYRWYLEALKKGEVRGQ
jgi:GDP-L-fucose synthase